MKIRLQARAVEGAANAALVEFIAMLCNCPKSSISLLSGETSRAKSLLIAGAGQPLLDKLKKESAPR